MKNLKKDNKGFTIIEVLIVLAIAGLIMLVVFLAVPALQRNARNTQRKADVSAVLGGLSEYSNNNGGSFPGAVTVDTASATAWFCKTSPCTLATSTPAKLGFYNTAATSVTLATLPSPLPVLTATDSVIHLYQGATCVNDIPTAGSARAVVAYYIVEPNAKAVCTES